MLSSEQVAEIKARATSAHITARRERYQGHPRWTVEIASVEESVQTFTDNTTLGAALDEYRWMCRRMPALLADRDELVRRLGTLEVAARRLVSELDNPNWPGNDDAIHEAVGVLNAALTSAAPLTSAGPAAPMEDR